MDRGGDSGARSTKSAQAGALEGAIRAQVSAAFPFARLHGTCRAREIDQQ